MGRWHQGNFKPQNPDKYLGNLKNITYRSSWELKAFIDLDRSPSVIGWAAEPIAIPYYDPTTKKARRYFVDLFVKVREKDGKITCTLIEIKPLKETIAPESNGKNRRRFLKEALTYGKNQAKWTSARAFCQERGWKFKIMTERDLGINF